MKIDKPLHGVAAVAVCVGVLFAWVKLPDAASPSPVAAINPVLTVAVVAPQQEKWPHTLLASGGIFAWQEAIVASEIGGLAVTAVLVDVGSEVKRGQELVTLSDAALQAVLGQQRANVARVEANLALAVSNAGRARGLKGSSAMSEQQATQYLLSERAAKAELAAVQAALRVEEVHLRQTHITAVDDGVITARSVTLGSVVQVGSELFRLLRQKRLEWRAELTAAQMNQVRAGLPARLTLTDGRVVDAVARQVGPTLDVGNRRGLVYFDLPATSTARAGMFAEGEIVLGEAPGLILPQKAIVMRDGNAYIFTLGADHVVTEHKVVTGRRRGEQVEVVRGVTPASRVVVAGGAFLHDGDRVRVVAGEVNK
ncbi:MAG: efflux RND transporter periplasmic adaptor subunit [Magnetococcales bacterium]|nr:efflux RND transporter periplasmic adaptor subunit [Magnetococcales bacterium]